MMHALLPRFAVGLMLTPAALSIGAVGIANAAGLESRANAAAAREACFRSENYAALARIPAGLIAADIDYGPFLLALTPHRILAAPYHRLSSGIIEAHGAKVGETERRAIEDALASLKEAVKGDNAEDIQAKTNALAQASMKLGEAMYADAQKNAGGPGGPGGDAGPSAGAPKDDVVDAEFTEVDDDKNKKKSA